MTTIRRSLRAAIFALVLLGTLAWTSDAALAQGGEAGGFTGVAAGAGPPPTKASPCGPRNPFGKGSVCVQQYALCISAPCVEVAGSSGKPAVAECVCEVLDGASIGQASCADRAPGTDGQGRKTVVSTYSFQQTLPTYRLMTCPGEMNGQPLRYADCYGFSCTVEANDPARATCTCPIFESKGGTFITRGGRCDTKLCAKIWSAAPSTADELVNWQYACDLGLPHPPEPFACPGS